MLFVHHKHRYFRIQVIVSVVVSMAVYLAVKFGLIGASNHSSPARSLGIPMFTLGPILAACVLVYFQQGTLRLAPVIGFSGLLYGVVLIWPFVITANEGDASFSDQEAIYFVTLNFVGFLIFGGISAWLGKLFGILALAAFSYSAYSGVGDLLVLTPLLAVFNITNLYAQWTVALFVAVSSFIADR